MNKRRLLSILTCLALCLTLLPTAALAAVGETIHVGGVKLTTTAENPTVYARTVEGAVTTDGANESSYNIMWDGSTLTLNGATITQGSNQGAAISYYNNDPGNGGISQLDLVLVGENTVTGPDLESSSVYNSYGIHVAGDSLVGTVLTISGAGSLTATGGTVSKSGTYWSAGICNSVGDISVEGGTVKATGGPSSGRSAGIHSQYKLTISGGTVNAAGGESESSYGIYSSSRGITISGGTVTAEGATQAVRTTGTVTVDPEGGEQIEVTAGESAASAAAISGSPFTREAEINENTTIGEDSTALVFEAKYFHSIAGEAENPGPDPDPDPDTPDPNIYVGGVGLYGDKASNTTAYALTNESGAVTTTGATADNYTIMWDGETLTLSGATITQGSHENAAIYYHDRYTAIHLVLMGESTVTGPNSSEGSCGIDVSGDLTIDGSGTLTVTGGDVTVTDTTYAISYGIDAPDIIISSGTVNATGGTVSGNNAISYGIDASDITISGGIVNATGGTAASGNADDSDAESCGIYADNVIVSGGAVTATGGDASGNSLSYGIYVDEDATISGGTVTATGGSASGEYAYSRGIYADNVIVSNGTVTADGGEVTATSNEGYAESFGIYVTNGLTISGGEVTAEGATQAVRSTGTVTVDPVEGQQITVTAGADESSAQEIDDSPFTGEASITSLIGSAKYFHSIAEAAEGPDPIDSDLYVGGVGLTGSKDTPAYALTDGNGKVTKDGAGPDHYTIMWDGGTLTLNNAVITQGSHENAAIYHYDHYTAIHLVLMGESTVTGPSSSEGSCGIDVSGDLTISGSGTLTVTGGDVTAAGTDYAESYGIDAPDIIISGGTVHATGGTVSGNHAISYGIDASDITISGGTVNATGGTAASGSADDSDAESCGIYATGGVTISGGAVTATGGSASGNSLSFGINAENVTVSDGTATATGGEVSGNNTYSCGINATMGVTISGGEVTAEGDTQAVRTTGTVIIDPAEREQITVTVGADESSAAEITGSPFQEETEITGLASAAGVTYFKSAAEPARYSVTLHPNGGTIADGKDVTSYLCGTGASLPGAGDVTRSGYRFAGWYADEALTDGPYTQISAADAGDMAFYARWVRRSSGGGGGSSSRPTGPSTGHSDGWTDIREEIGSAEDGDTVTIDMNGETEVPAEIFEEIAGKDITVELDMGGGVTWTVDGRDVPEDVSLSDLDLGVDMDTSGISVDVINTVTGEYGAVQVSLDHDGAFGFALTLTAPLGRENAGYWANLYHYDEGEEALTFETSARIAADGSAALRMTHASQYAIVIDEKSHALPFEDVGTDAWYSDAVAYVYRNGLMSGTSGSTFSPDAAITRAQLVTILWRMAGSPQVNGLMDFDDVSQDAYYAEAVRWAASEGIAGGYGNGLFGSDDPITREQMAAILYRFAQHMGYDVSIGEDTNILSYTDALDVSGYAVAALQWACGAGIIRGTGDGSTLTPQGGATRAQAAVILTRFCAQSQ